MSYHLNLLNNGHSNKIVTFLILLGSDQNSMKVLCVHAGELGEFWISPYDHKNEREVETKSEKINKEFPLYSTHRHGMHFTRIQS